MSTRIFTWSGQRPLIVPKNCNVLINDGTKIREIEATSRFRVPANCRVINKEMLGDAFDKSWPENWGSNTKDEWFARLSAQVFGEGET